MKNTSLKNNLTIWRVEDKEGLGPYRTEETLDILWDLHSGSVETRPSPDLDKGIKRNCDFGEICGFLTKEQAYQWFDKITLRKLAMLGYELKEVVVREITAIGQTQVLAVR